MAVVVVVVVVVVGDIAGIFVEKVGKVVGTVGIAVVVVEQGSIAGQDRCSDRSQGQYWTG